MDDKTILVADDEYGFRYPILIYLKNNGFNVIEASNREEVFKKIAKADILIIDVIFPDKKEGIEIVKEIRQSTDNKIKSIPVIFYSILNESTWADELRELNNRSYRWLQKPFELSELLKAFSELKRIT